MNQQLVKRSVFTSNKIYCDKLFHFLLRLNNEHQEKIAGCSWVAKLVLLLTVISGLCLSKSVFKK
ncbi:unnamed protein product [Tenebrio molitor]|nr:unnamed protein product [Tenebrio molitor]